MKRSLSYLTFAMAVAAFSNSANAQSYTFSPININAKKLPVNFLGHSPVATYYSLNDRKASKGKFETSAQFEARQKKLLARPLFNGVYSWSVLGFAVAPSWCDYNADTQQFKAHFALYQGDVYEPLKLSLNRRPDDFSLGDMHDVLRTTTQSYLEYSDTYEAQNAFGAQVTVESEGRSTYGFAVTNWKDFAFVPTGENSNVYRLSYNTKVPPSKAPRLEKDISVLYVGYPTKPYQLNDIAGKSATYDSPYASSTSFYYTAFRLKEVWFYDGASGYIFGKLLPKKFTSVSTSQPIFTPTKIAAAPIKSVPKKADGTLKTNGNCCTGISKKVSGDLLSTSKSGVVSFSQAQGFSDQTLRLAINEMFARYGLTFKDPGLQAYFCARTWYKPDVNQTGDAILGAMTDNEKANLKLLSAERNKRAK